MKGLARTGWFCLAALLLVATGCASRDAVSGKAGAGLRPASAADPSARLTDAELERRAQAMAAFSAGIIDQARDDTDAALESFARSLENDPTNEALAIDVGRRYLAREQADKAYEVLRRTARQPGTSGMVQSLLGLTCIQLGKTSEAVAAYRESIRLNPTLVGSYQALAQLFSEQKKPDAALRILEQAAGQPVDDPAYWVELAETYGRFELANPSLRDPAQKRSRECLVKAEELKPASPVLLRRMADRYLALGDSARAEAMLKELAAAGRADPQVAARLAELYLRSGRLAEAREQFEDMERFNPANPVPAYFLGVIAIEEKDFTKAVKLIGRALVLNPEFEGAYSDLAVAQIGQGQAREALATLDKARQKFPPEFRREFLTAMAHANLEEFDASKAAFDAAEKAARDIQPEALDHRFYLQRGAMLERAGRHAEAVASLEKSLSLKPDFDEALNHLGYMWAEQGVNLDRARDMIERAVKAEPENAAYLDSLGWVFFKLGKPTDALTWLEKAIRLLKEPDATVLDHLGDVLQTLGRQAEARDAWKKSLELEASDAVKRKLESAP